MELTTKEKDLLKDLRDQEKLCIMKYEKYASCAGSQELQTLFNSMAKVEREHHKTIVQMMDGKVDQAPSSISNSSDCSCGCCSYSDEESRKNDAFMCSDMLATEKHVSALYDTCVFEFTNPEARKMLNHIQAEEQQHGQQLYTFMSNNNMSNI